MKQFSVDLPAGLVRLASNPRGDPDTVLRKSALVITSLMIAVAATICGFIYVAAGEPKDRFLHLLELEQ